jgi:hypothetical protein
MIEFQEQDCNLELFDWKKYLMVTAHMQQPGFRAPQTVLCLQKVGYSELIPIAIGMLKCPPIANLQNVCGHASSSLCKKNIKQ